MKIFKTIQSDLLKYNGMECKVLSPMVETEYDKLEVGPMYNIQLENGLSIQAFRDEIISL